MTKRLLVTARNSNFPSLSDGIPVHSQDRKPGECSTAGAAPGLRQGAGRALLHLRSLGDEELAMYARQLGDGATDLELELAGRVLNLIDALDEATNTYKGDDE